MNLTDWYALLESSPPTSNQVGRIGAEFDRLGFVRNERRRERLAITAALANVDDLGSTLDLTQGQAGRVVRALENCRSSADLPAVKLHRTPAKSARSAPIRAPASMARRPVLPPSAAAETSVSAAEMAAVVVCMFAYPIQTYIVLQLAALEESRRWTKMSSSGG